MKRLLLIGAGLAVLLGSIIVVMVLSESTTQFGMRAYSTIDLVELE